MLLIALAACLLIPANLTFCATALMFVVPVRRMKWEWHHLLFLAWILWAALGCILSPHAEMAIYGHGMRMEGLLTWIVISRMAWLVWESWESWLIPVLALLALITFIAVCGTELPPKLAFLGEFKMTRITMGNLSAMLVVLLWTWSPLSVVLALPLLIVSDCRGALFAAIAGIGVFVMQSWKQPSRKAVYAGIVMIVLIAGAVFLSPLGKKLSRMNPSTFGSGARSQWALQAQEKARERPFLGHGLDTLSTILTPVESKYSLPKSQVSITDRTHNLVLDILLQTGWIGLALGGLALGHAAGMAVKMPEFVNRQCLAVLVCWVVMSMFNPAGIPALLVALMALFGVNRYRDDEKNLVKK